MPTYLGPPESSSGWVVENTEQMFDSSWHLRVQLTEDILPGTKKVFAFKTTTPDVLQKTLFVLHANAEGTANVEDAIGGGTQTIPLGPVAETIVQVVESHFIAVGTDSGKIGIHLADKNGIISLTGSLSVPGSLVSGVGVADVNNDGNDDIVALNANFNSNTMIHSLLGDGYGTFAAPVGGSITIASDYFDTWKKFRQCNCNIYVAISIKISKIHRII